MFIDPNSPYFGITADCADSAYLFRAIFSYENYLPFAIIDPQSYSNGLSSRENLKVFSNDSSQFNQIQDPNKRFIAFANRVAASVGTWSLKTLDTYPIALENLRPGDIYHYEIDKDTATIRHTVSVKDMDAFGNFSFIYSTQSIKKSNVDFFKQAALGRIPAESKKTRRLMFKTGQSANYVPDSRSGGFRRFIWPRYLKSNPDQYPASWNYSLSQFELSESMNSKEFALHVKKIHATQDEGLTNKVKRQLDNLCQQLQERVETVNESIWYQEKIKSEQSRTCMNYEEFDTYSTPMRDSEIRKAFEEVLSQVQKDHLDRLPSDLKSTLTALMNKQGESNDFCTTEIATGQNTNLIQLYNSLQEEKLSSDPNQSAAARWGMDKEAGSNCQVFYN